MLLYARIMGSSKLSMRNPLKKRITDGWGRLKDMAAMAVRSTDLQGDTTGTSLAYFCEFLR